MATMPINVVVDPVWLALYRRGWEDPMWGRSASNTRHSGGVPLAAVVGRTTKVRLRGESVSALRVIPAERGWELLAELEQEHVRATGSHAASSGLFFDALCGALVTIAFNSPAGHLRLLAPLVAAIKRHQDSAALVGPLITLVAASANHLDTDQIEQIQAVWQSASRQMPADVRVPVMHARTGLVVFPSIAELRSLDLRATPTSAPSWVQAGDSFGRGIGLGGQFGDSGIGGPSGAGPFGSGMGASGGFGGDDAVLAGVLAGLDPGGEVSSDVDGQCDKIATGIGTAVGGVATGVGLGSIASGIICGKDSAPFAPDLSQLPDSSDAGTTPDSGSPDSGAPDAGTASESGSGQQQKHGLHLRRCPLFDARPPDEGYRHSDESAGGIDPRGLGARGAERVGVRLSANVVASAVSVAPLTYTLGVALMGN